jgi:hypothetical protein
MENRGKMAKIGKLTTLLLILLTICAVNRPIQAETSIYVFDSNQSIVVKTGGFASVQETYSVTGQFQLIVDSDIGIASFEKVNASLTDETDSVYGQSLDEIFNMTGITATVIDDTTIEFEGKTADGTESNVRLKLSFSDDSAHLTGQTTPPPNSAYMSIYEIDTVATRKYASGTGEPNDPYLIYTAEQMNAIGAEPNDWDKHFKLMADIDLAGYIGTDFNIIGYWVDWSSPDNKPFVGVFEGNGHTISNFTSKGTNRIGLFGYVDGKNAHIKDLGLIDPNIDARRDVGSLVGHMRTGAITGCYAEGGSVGGSSNVGGLVGFQDYGTITNCYATVSVSGDTSAGGLVGINNCWCRISDCYSTASVSGKEYIGGLVGLNRGTIANCYVQGGSVLGSNTVGGFVGSNGWPQPPMARPYPLGEIINCYSTASVSGSNHVGGLVGRQGYGKATASFWDKETSGQTISDGGTGKTTAEMQVASTFFAWACEPTVWTIDEGVDYPRLAWENKPGDPLPVISEFLAGSGTQTDPYLIYTAQELDMVGQFPCEWDKHFKLMNNIDLSDYAGTAFNIIGYYIDFYSPNNKPFIGVFDGNSHTILNFSYTSTDENCIGLFGYVAGVIKNLGLIDPNVDAGTGWHVGSLVGYLNNGTIINFYDQACSVSGNGYVGGLVGLSYLGIITNCYSSGDVSGKEYVGGLMGYNYRGTITNCYSVARVTGSSTVGGLIGNSREGQVTGSFWDVQTSGQMISAGGMGLTTAEMQTTSTFLEAGWDFVGETENGTEDIWWILEGQDYPRLWWEIGDETSP